MFELSTAYVRTTGDARTYLSPFFTDQEDEVCVTVMMNAGGKVIATHTNPGGRNWVMVVIDEIAATAMRHRAKMAVMAHNHPCGTIDFSQADVVVTRRLFEQLQICNCRLVDHLLFAGEHVISLREQGGL